MTTIEETLVLVKPDGVARNLTGEILRRIEAKGYQLVDIKLVQADRELLGKHYEEHEGKPFYEPLVSFMESGPVVAIRVTGNRVIEGFRSLAGTTDPTHGGPGHHPRRPRSRLGTQGSAEPRARLGLARVCRPRTRPLVRLIAAGAPGRAAWRAIRSTGGEQVEPELGEHEDREIAEHRDQRNPLVGSPTARVIPDGGAGSHPPARCRG